jgi:hypothetical protein
MQNPIAFLPHKIEIVYVILIAIIEAYLTAIAIILQLPVWRRCDNKMNTCILNLIHPPAVADDYDCLRLHQSRPLAINLAGKISIDSIESYKKALVKKNFSIG